MARVKAFDLPRWIYLWCIPLPLVIQLVAGVVDRHGEFFVRWIESESGLIENGTALLLFPACFFATRLALRFSNRRNLANALWFAGVALLCFGFAGEEVSWGQHWWGWSSPEFFAENNRQGETNFHNLHIDFGRVVKSILTLLIIIGGLILPLRQPPSVIASNNFDRFLDRVLPTIVCVPAAAFVLGVRLIERCKTWFDLEWTLLAVNLKESQELYIALFLLIYTWSAHRRAGAPHYH
jgi:hypothetical protein